MASAELAHGYLALPQGASPKPGVVMLPDVWGLSAHTRDLAGRLAAEGFAVLALDIYRRTGRPELSDPAAALDWIAALPDPLVLETIREGAEALAAHEAVAGRIGVTGFCMGGQYALLAACGVPGFSACAPFYGMLRYAEGLDAAKKPRAPLAALRDLRCPVLGFYGEQDELIPVADVLELREGLAASPHAGEVILYPGAGHAFMNDTRPALHRPEAAADAWRRLAAFLHETLDG